MNDMLRAADLNRGVAPSGVLLGEFMDRWLEDQVYPRLRQQSCELYSREVRLRLKPELGDIPLQRLTSRDVSGMEDRLLMRGVGLSVLRYARQVLTSILNYALKSGLITRSPMTGLGALAYRPKEPVVPDVASVIRVLKHLREVEPEFYAPCHLLAHTGMRSGEVLALRWADVSLAGGHLAVVNNLMKVPGGGLGLVRPRLVLVGGVLIWMPARWMCSGSTARGNWRGGRRLATLGRIWGWCFPTMWVAICPGMRSWAGCSGGPAVWA